MASERNRADRAIFVLPGQLRMAPFDLKSACGRSGINERYALVDGLLHSGCDGANKIGVFFQLRAMVENFYSNMSVAHEPETHPVTSKAGCQRRYKGRRRALKAFLARQYCHRVNNRF